MSRYPDFFIVGAAKSGTTALWNFLAQHPNIYMTKDIKEKELGFFSDFYGINDEKKYLSFFNGANDTQLVGEVCHAYLSSPESAQKIFEKVPKAKIVIILRNPVHRAYSLYNWMTMHGYENANTFEEALDIESKRQNDSYFKKNNPHGFYMNYNYFSSGVYFDQVLRYYNLFGKENCLLIVYEEFIANPNAEINRLCNFLNISNNFNPVMSKINESKRVRSVKWQFYANNQLPYYFRKFGFSKRFNKFIKKIIHGLNTTNKKPEKINKKTALDLTEKYKYSIQQLSQLVNIDFSKYWL